MSNSSHEPLLDEPRIVPRVLGMPLDGVGLILGPTAMIAWIVLADVGLDPPAHRLAGVLLWTLIWWITEPVPIAVTGLMAVALCVFVGAVPVDAAGKQTAADIVLAPFGNTTMFFLMGGMFLGRAMSRHGLDRRLALSILAARWAGRSPATVLLAVGVGTAAISMWISNTAATAMVYPVAMGIVAVLSTGAGAAGNQFARSRYATALLLMTAYASTVGGIATPIGTTTNVVAMGFFRRPDYFGRPVDFFRWSLVGVPMMLVLFVALFAWLRWLGPAGELDMPKLRGYLRAQHEAMGRWNRGEINTLIVFLTVVSLWVAPGVLALASTQWRGWFNEHFPEEVVALLAPILLYLLPVDWRGREFSLGAADFLKIDWSTLMLFGAGLSLGNLMRVSGLADAMAQAAIERLGADDVWAVTAVAIAGGVLLSEITSNAATAAALIPVTFSLCHRAGVDPLPPLLGLTFGASFGNALPVSTPPNAIVYGSGLIPVRRMVVAGLGLDILAGLVIWCVLRAAFALGWTPLG